MTQTPRPRSLTPVVLILLIALAPVVFALIAYFMPASGLRPGGSTNYGELIDPQRPLPPAETLSLRTLDDRLYDLESLHGHWVLVSADHAACPESCVRKLFILRNSHASQGKEVERLRRVWFILDEGEVDKQILEAYKGTVMLRARPETLGRFLVPDANAGQAADALLAPMWIIDPLGNLMMRFPADADPIKVRDDIRKLLRNSRIG
ncbi:MAG: hypothetical protein WCY98_02295 [Castellaniella sp.]